MAQDMVLEARKVLAPSNTNNVLSGPLSQPECLEIRAGIHVGKLVTVNLFTAS